MRIMSHELLDELRKMPPRRHGGEGREPDIVQGESTRWMACQPEIMRKIFDTACAKHVMKYKGNIGMRQGGGGNVGN